MNRRMFLGLGAAFVAGCQAAPGRPGWGLLELAEGLSRWVARPFRHALAREYPASMVSGQFPIRSLTLPAGYAETLPGWALRVEGLVAKPGRYPLAALKADFPRQANTTRHDCVEGWSAIAEWAGVPLHALLAAVEPLPEARYVVFRSADFDAGTQAPFYGSLELEDARHPQTVLAYEMNGAPLTIDHGAPLRLKVPTQLGYKSTKFVHTIALVASLDGLGGGKGGYWEDAGYEHWAGI